jgi:hypothetical protein
LVVSDASSARVKGSSNPGAASPEDCVVNAFRLGSGLTAAIGIRFFAGGSGVAGVEEGCGGADTSDVCAFGAMALSARGDAFRAEFAVRALGANAHGPPNTSGISETMWRWPLHGPRGGRPEVMRGFQPPAQRWLSGHRGVDLGAPEGAPVLAAGPGTVAFSGALFGRGVVVISHGSVRTTYEPVLPSVHVGEAVARGSPIGTLAAGHCVQHACLHWGLLTGHRHGARYYDPLILLGLSHLRLEPAP